MPAKLHFSKDTRSLLLPLELFEIFTEGIFKNISRKLLLPFLLQSFQIKEGRTC